MPKNVGKVTCTSIKCYGSPPNESRVVPCGWADRRTDGLVDIPSDRHDEANSLPSRLFRKSARKRLGLPHLFRSFAIRSL
jgi:hypothetical protein